MNSEKCNTQPTALSQHQRGAATNKGSAAGLWCPYRVGGEVKRVCVCAYRRAPQISHVSDIAVMNVGL